MARRRPAGRARTGAVSAAAGGAAHWERAYRERGATAVSWFETSPRMSLEMLDALGTGPDRSVVDVGGGASGLAGVLAARGSRDVTVLDVSRRALDAAAAALPPGADVTLLCRDVLEWEPERTYDLWHDRALFHFLVEPLERERYVATAGRAVAPGGAVVVAAFAPTGPERCSGLPVARQDASAIAAAFGDGFELVDAREDAHMTPGGTTQVFTWAALRRAGRDGR